jgi:GT2 family glycosyltransferase
VVLSSATRVSVIIPARDAAPSLEATLTALAHQTAPAGSYEVIVVDDGSRDGTSRIAERFGEQVQVLRQPATGGFAARNRGAQEARAPLLAFTDADCIPSPTWLEHGVGRFDRNGEVDLLAGRIASSLGARPSLVALLDAAQNYEQERYASEGHAASGNLWVRRMVFERLGGFHTGVRRGGDTEFSTRAVAAGHAVVYANEVEVAHPPMSRGGLLVRRAYRDGREAGRRGSSLFAHRWRHGAYVPTASLDERLQRLGHPLGPLRLTGLILLKQVGLRLPLLVGNVVGLLSTRVGQATVPACPRDDVDPAGGTSAASGCPAVSVIVVALNAREHVLRCLQSLDLCAEADTLSYETIVVDDGSTDGTAAAVRERFPNTKLILKERNEGLVAGRNAAVKVARGRFVLMLDADTEVGAGAIETLKLALERSADVGLVGPRLIYPDGRLQHSCRRFPGLTLPWWRRSPLALLDKNPRVHRHHLMQDWTHGHERPVVWLAGAAQMWRRELAQQIGPYDIRVSSYGGEDLDWCLRVWRAGLAVNYVPEAEIVHVFQQVTRQRRYGRQSARALIDYYYLQWKHRGLRHDPRLREAQA